MIQKGLSFAVLYILVIQLCACANSGFSVSDWFSFDAKDDNNDELAMQPMVNENADIPDSGVLFRKELKQNIAKNQGDKPSQTSQQAIQYRTPNTLYSPTFSHKSLSDYAEQLTMKLMNNGHKLTLDSLVGVTTFVNFDQSLKNSSALGNQLAELLISELQTLGVAVADFKTLDQISVNRSGDFVFSREAQQLSANMAMSYVLSGTLIRNEKGVKVNARIIDVQSKQVVSAASLFIPDFVVQALHPSYVIVSTN